MPASSIDLFHMQDAKNNFNAMRPAPVCSDTTNQLMGQCQNVHISKNCYYGYQETKNSENNTDCEMKETPIYVTDSLPKNGKKRCAEFFIYPESKRLREEGMVPSTSTHNPRLLRPTHNNPDISRCLMKYKERKILNLRQLRPQELIQALKIYWKTSIGTCMEGICFTFAMSVTNISDKV